jgi:hypothetical protein
VRTAAELPSGLTGRPDQCLRKMPEGGLRPVVERHDIERVAGFAPGNLSY